MSSQIVSRKFARLHGARREEPLRDQGLRHKTTIHDAEIRCPSEDNGWKWTVKVIEKWSDVVHGDHFVLVKCNGNPKKVNAGVSTGENHQKNWETVVEAIANVNGKPVGYILKGLRQIVEWGTKSLGGVQIRPTDLVLAEHVDLMKFYEHCQRVSASQQRTSSKITKRPTPGPLTGPAELGAERELSMEEQDDAGKEKQREEPKQLPLEDEEFSELEDKEGDMGRERNSSKKIISAHPHDFRVNGKIVAAAIQTVHGFYENLQGEGVEGFKHLNNRGNRRMMKALGKMADGAAEAWNMGCIERADGDVDLGRQPLGERSRFERELTEFKRMVGELHTKTGLVPKKETEADKKRKQADIEKVVKKRAQLGKKDSKTDGQGEGS
ncbi:hypothetical protein EV426DRAFT_668910 [Tirmania nivea]|nr:hypothetical protein EV426DRAFT_668910 [Tirmania nivea]